MIGPAVPDLEAAGFDVRFTISDQLSEYCQARGWICAIFPNVQKDALILAGTDLVLVGTSEQADCIAHKLVAMAKTAGIASVGLIDMVFNADRRFRGGSDDPFAFMPDYLLCADREAVDAFCAIGVDAGRLRHVGHPVMARLDRAMNLLGARDRGELREEQFGAAAAGRPVWVFVSEGIDRLDPSQSYWKPSWWLTGTGTGEFRGTAVLRQVCSTADRLGITPWLVLRNHPTADPGLYDPLSNRVDQISSGGDPYPLAYAADLVIGMTSMFLLEAGWLGCPTLSVLPDEREMEWLPAGTAKILPVALSAETLSDYLSQGVPAVDGALRQLYPKFAGARIAEFCWSLIADKGRTAS